MAGSFLIEFADASVEDIRNPPRSFYQRTEAVLISLAKDPFRPFTFHCPYDRIVLDYD